MFYDLWGLFDLCLLEVSTKCDANFRNRLGALLYKRSLQMAFGDDGMGASAD